MPLDLSYVQLTVDYAEQFKRLGDRLALERISEAALSTRVLDRLFAVKDGMPERAARRTLASSCCA